MIRTLTLLAMTAVFLAPVAAQAGESSYQMKKQGRVAFKDLTETTQDTSTAASPESIEPAAGASEDTMTEGTQTEQNAVAESIRLPRKN